METGRNEFCPCGSGKKYKKCCMDKPSPLLEVQNLLEKTIRASLVIQHEELVKAINQIEGLLKKYKFSGKDLENINLNLYQLYILAGKDKLALDLIESFDLADYNKYVVISILTHKIKCMLNLGMAKEAFDLAIELKKEIDNIEWNEENGPIKSGALIEVGKTINQLINIISNEGKEIDYEYALDCYDELIESYEKGKYKAIDHYLGAKANKAGILLYDQSAEIQGQGVKLIKQVISEKIKVGYWTGVANDYCRLSLYYFRKKNYKQAIAHTKRDIALTRRFGSQRDLTSSLINLSMIYLDSRQISEAKQTLREVIKICTETDNSSLRTYCTNLLEKVNISAKELNINDISIGKKSPCICGSGNSFEDCCGQADFDYGAIDKVLGLDSIIPYAEFPKEDEADDSKASDLNMVLRKLDDDIRLSWIKIHYEGAYQEVFELPDMATINLISAKKIIEGFPTENLLKEVSVALSAIMLSVSALEAFLNQIIYFLSTTPIDEIPACIKENIPEDLLSNYQDFQRNTRFTDKISIIGQIMCKEKWSRASCNFYDDLFKLISIRNELVHFKSVEYYKIIPPQNDELLHGLNPNIQLRDITNAWPLKILTKSFAEWSIQTVEKFINYIKENYANNTE